MGPHQAQGGQGPVKRSPALGGSGWWPALTHHRAQGKWSADPTAAGVPEGSWRSLSLCSRAQGRHSRVPTQALPPPAASSSPHSSLCLPPLAVGVGLTPLRLPGHEGLRPALHPAIPQPRKDGHKTKAQPTPVEWVSAPASGKGGSEGSSAKSSCARPERKAWFKNQSHPAG